ncbi:MAG: T9SS C-terminal target domain-containing protein [Bacteroidetes bacterium]|nr:MAG: T9SS C-terminal target domain-containing protein [Bacteroidota bacterium]
MKHLNTYSYLFRFASLLCLLLIRQGVYAQPDRFSFTPTNASGLVYGQVEFNGIAATDNDWIAAFDASHNCAGAAQLILNGGIAYINLPVYGDDPTTEGIDEGMNGGEAFYLQLYVAALDKYVNFRQADTLSWFTDWANTNGTPIPAYNDINTIYSFFTATFAPMDPVCVNSVGIPLSGGLPAGGTYSGPGVENNLIFNPALAGIGTHQLAYTITAPDGTRDTATSSILVRALPQVSLAAFPSLCVNEAALALEGGTPAGGSYSGPGVEDNVFDPGQAGIGIHQITYAYTDTNGCRNTATASLEVLDRPSVAFSFETTDSSVVFSSTATGASSFRWLFGDGNESTQPNPEHVYTASGTNLVSLIASNACGSDTATSEVPFIVSSRKQRPGSPRIRIFPNPNKGSFQLSASGLLPGELQLRITNLLGKEVYRSSLNTGHQLQQAIRLPDVANGIYMLHLQQGKLHTVKKFSVLR